MTGALDGVRVVELARFQAGPRAGMVLSDLGADVIKVEPPGGEETRRMPPLVRGQSVYFSVYNRGKKSVCVDLRSAPGKAVLADLVRTSDVVLENFRPGVIADIGFGYERLRELNPGIVLVSVSGFGQTGPYRDRPAFDSLGQAMSGLMALTGKPVGQPVGTAASIVDRLTALHATIGTLAALRHRERTGEGQVVDVCLLDAALTMVEIPTAFYLATGQEGGEGGRPPYRAKDGWVVISAAARDMAARLMTIVTGGASPAPTATGPRPAGTPDDTPMAGSTGGGDARRALVESWCAARTVGEICAILGEHGVPAAPVRDIAEVAHDPHLWEREMLVKTDDPVAGETYLPGATIKLSKTPARVGRVPRPGEHTDQVLGGILGYERGAIAELRTAGAIA
jgi:crotonobetainyl-CoA:carnitine CoA-transferase CaiB-like acyl-CoA transferase